MVDSLAATSREELAPVAGIRIVHHVPPTLSFQPPAVDDWVGSPESEPPLTLWHEVGDVSVAGLNPVFDVEPWSTYYDDGKGGITVLFHSHDPETPVHTLESVRPGYEYRVRYSFAPRVPQMRRDKEMAAYAVALGARRRGLMAHGCGFVLPSGRGALCLGVSGAGKSTLGRLMRAQPGVRVLNDDRNVLTPEAGGIGLWSTPWPGSAGIAKAGEAPLGVVAFISRGAAAAVRPVPRGDLVRRLFATIALPLWDSRQVDEALTLLTTAVERVPFVEIAYPLVPDPGPWIVKTLTELAE